MNGIDPIVGIKESDNVYLKSVGLSKRVKSLYHTHNVLFEGEKWFKGQCKLTRKIMVLLGHYCDCTQLNKEYWIKLLKQGRFDVFEPTLIRIFCHICKGNLL